MIEINGELRGQAGLWFALRDLSDSIEDYSPAWVPIRTVFREIMSGQFTSQGARGGKKWANLSPAYKRWKERVAPGRPILVLTGRLKQSLIGKTGDTIDVGDTNSLTLGTKVPYAKYHQYGTESFSYSAIRYSTRVPARPPIVIKPMDYALMSAYMVSLSAEYGVNAGFRLKNGEQIKKRLTKRQTKFAANRDRIAKRGVIPRRG